MSQEPYFQAIGLLEGELKTLDEPGKFEFVLGGGKCATRCAFTCSISKKLRFWLKANPGPRQGLWLCYPKTSKDGAIALHIKAYAAKVIPQLEPGTFKIRGRIIYANQQTQVIAARVERNQPVRPEQRQYFNLTISGFLPGRCLGQFWALLCGIDAGKLMILDGTRLDRPEPPKLKPKKSRPPKPIKGSSA